MNRRQILSGAASLGAAFAAAAPRPANGAASGNRRSTASSAALNAHDIKAFADLFAEDYVNHQASAAAPAPSDKSAEGRDGRLLRRPHERPCRPRRRAEVSLAQGDLAAASFVYEGVHSAVYYGVAPTGRRLRFTSCDIFRVRDGRIAEHWGMGDIAGVLAQLRG